MRTVMALLFLLTACGDNTDPTFLPEVGVLPSCASVGCPDVVTTDKVCASTGDCTCAPTRATATACAASCSDLPCTALACGNLTPAGDVDPTACTCGLDGGGYAPCYSEPNR